MDPIPPPDSPETNPKPSGYRPWHGFAVWLVLWLGGQAWNGCQRDHHAERHDRKLDEIKAAMMEQQKRRE